ncbi:MAG: outer membrane protein insertion porin family [Saprospiraceae bacterium]|jgi:outer membrane protein insertion porin family
MRQYYSVKDKLQRSKTRISTSNSFRYYMTSIISTLTLFAILLLPAYTQAQVNDTLPVIEYGQPKDFEIGGIKVYGAQYSDENAIIAITGLKVGDKVRIPGEKIYRAIKALWKLRLFTDVEILQEKLIGDVIFLEIYVTERPRLARHSFKNVKKSLHDDLNDDVNKFLLKGGIVTENIKTNASNAVKEYFQGKGYLDAVVTVEEIPDEKLVNAVRLVFEVEKKGKVKIEDITFTGITVKPKKLRKKMDETHRKRKIFSASKLIQEDYEADKKNIIAYYNTIGFRDAKIISDSIWREKDGDLQIHLNIFEGNQYYFRDISWKGNSIYDVPTLASRLGIEKGEVYNTELLETRLRFSQDGRDVSTLYMDNGYLFFQIDPIETSIIDDSIDLELRIYEGPQATIDKVSITGNDRTHEHVIRRELRTRPGQKFSRSDIIRSQREIINLGYFNPEALDINTPVNAQRGTVDIEYKVEEKPSDQLELSAGWAGSGRGVIGTLGVSFNNFSVRNIFKKESWSPLPQGDGQRLSLRAQTNGRFFQSYNVSFTEPWLGGKKPTSFTVAGFYNRFAFGDRAFSNFQRFVIAGGTVTLGTRLKWPDDNFISQTAVTLQNLSLENWNRGLFITEDGQVVTDGNYYNFSVTQTFTRSTVSDPLFPNSGSRFTLAVSLTPPYSLFNNKDYTDLPVNEKFKFLEYNKWKFNAEWYVNIFDKFVIKTAAKIGMIDSYNDEIGISPFERFQLGGDGLANQQFGAYTGVDLISLRGYEENELPANVQKGSVVATPIYDKFTIELRYPISTNPSSTIYALAFVEGGNSFRTFRDFNPFDLKRSAGVGLRVFLPMFGTLGFDYGLGFDKPDDGTDGSIFAKYGNFNIILGFEPE